MGAAKSLASLLGGELSAPFDGTEFATTAGTDWLGADIGGDTVVGCTVVGCVVGGDTTVGCTAVGFVGVPFAGAGEEVGELVAFEAEGGAGMGGASQPDIQANANEQRITEC